jgi:hypothetical protein
MSKFQKGNTVGIRFGAGQRAGRPKLVVAVAELARERTTEAIETLTAIMRDRKATASARVSAAVAILERAWGKAPQTIDLRREIDLKELTDDELTLIAIGTVTEPNGSAGAAEPEEDEAVVN